MLSIERVVMTRGAQDTGRTEAHGGGQVAMTGRSVLLVPVAEVEPVVRRQVAEGAPEFLCRDGSRLHAHITLLGPFVRSTELNDGLLHELSAFFRRVEPFSFELTDVRVWRDWLAYLDPEPADPFRWLTLELFARYPDYPPYAGEYDGLTPHLTLGHLTAEQTPQTFAAELASILPVHATATHAELHWYEPNASRVLARFPFGGSATPGGPD